MLSADQMRKNQVALRKGQKIKVAAKSSKDDTIANQSSKDSIATRRSVRSAIARLETLGPSARYNSSVNWEFVQIANLVFANS